MSTMKKIFAIVALFSMSLLATQSFAQLAVDKGTKFVNLGIGFGGFGYGGIGFNAAADFGVFKNITVGPQVGYRSATDAAFTGFRVNYLDIGVRGAYHFNELINLPEAADLYAGLVLSYVNVSTSFSGYGGSASGLYVPIVIGGRYFFSEKVGAFAELGTAVSTLRAGVTFKLGQ